MFCGYFLPLDWRKQDVSEIVLLHANRRNKEKLAYQRYHILVYSCRSNVRVGKRVVLQHQSTEDVNLVIIGTHTHTHWHTHTHPS